MGIEFGYQYVDFDPDYVERIGGKVDLEKAINLFQSFPWDEQFAKASDRKDTNITSLVPGIHFYKSKKHFLSIYAQDNDGFMVHYEKGNYFSDLFVSNNIFEKPDELSVEKIIDFFYTDSLGEIINVFPKERNETRVSRTFELKYSKNKIFRPLLLLLLPLVFLFHQPFVAEVFMISFGIGETLILIFILPTLWLNYRYWKNDSDQSIQIDSLQQLIEITKGENLNRFSKKEIIACDFVHVRFSQRAWSEHSYLRLKTADNTFIITHLTVEPSELLNHLQIHFKDMEVFYPSLDYDIMSEKEKERIQKNFEKKKEEFLQRYNDYENEKLNEIINNKGKYADYAIAAAQEIMNKRKFTAVNRVGGR